MLENKGSPDTPLSSPYCSIYTYLHIIHIHASIMNKPVLIKMPRTISFEKQQLLICLGIECLNLYLNNYFQREKVGLCSIDRFVYILNVFFFLEDFIKKENCFEILISLPAGQQVKMFLVPRLSSNVFAFMNYSYIIIIVIDLKV